MQFVKPYLTLTIARATGDQDLVQALDLIKTELKKSEPTLEWADQEEGNLHLAYVSQFYTQMKEASWCVAGGPYIDYTNGYLSIVNSGDILLIHFSDSDLKDSFLKIVNEGGLPSISLFSAPEINFIFIKDKKIKALWLYGIHQRSTVKADSKTVFGQDLVDSIDLIGDQTYACSAARSQVPMSVYNKSIGVSPEKSSIWISQTDNWTQFMAVCADVILYIQSQVGSEESPIHTLPSPVKNLSGVNAAYDFDVLTSDQLPGQFSKRLDDLSSIVHSNYYFEINSAAALAGASFSLRVYEIEKGLRSYIGTVEVSTALSPAGKISFSETYNPQPGKKGRLVEFSRIFKNSDLVRVWFESGHVFTASRAYLVNYRDVEFQDYKWMDFSGYDVTKEKPLDSNDKVDLSIIGTSDSLFCWLKNEWITKAAPVLWGITNPTATWIACDDGAGERSDFIVISEFQDKLHVCFVHIKAAKSASGTKISVGAHDIVLNQSIKNIRYANYTGFNSSLSNMPANKKVWLNGSASTSASFVSFVNANVKKIEFSVVVVQPHTRRSFYTSGLSSLQKKQLDTLIINAKNVINGIGSEFYIAGQDI